MSESITDKELVEKAKCGDHEAFKLLVLKYQQRIMNLVVRFVHNVSDAEDITQEVFIKAYRALPKFRGDSAFYTWIYRIAANTAKNHLVVKFREPRKFAKDIDEMEQTGDSDTLKDNQTPEHLLLRDEIQKVITEAIDALPESLKIAITLREIEGLSYKDIAKVMGCPIGTVRSRIFRARKDIDKELKPLLENE